MAYNTMERIIQNAIDEYYDKDYDELEEEDSYDIDGKRVPRVTKIISICNPGMNGLMKWSNILGFKRIDYNKYMSKASAIGNSCHKAVEEYIKSGKEPEFSGFVDDDIISTTMNAFKGFRVFWDKFKASHKIKNTYIEYHLSTPWYAGTCDLLIEENNGTVTLYDFKTSNRVQTHHFIQLAAYKYALEHPAPKAPAIFKVDKIGILKLEKRQSLCTEYLLDLSIYENEMFVNHCQNCFFGMLYTYFEHMMVDGCYENVVMPRGY